MALIGNYSHRLKSPGRNLGGGSVVADPLVTARSNWGKIGSLRNFAFQDGSTTVARLAAQPSGTYAPVAWMMPIKAGALSSRNTLEIGATASANGVMGFPIVGATSIGLDMPNAAGELIAFGIGTSAIGFTTNAPLLTASISGAGSATFDISTNAPILGAEASCSGSADFGLTAYAVRLPASDAPVLREGTASFGFDGTLTSYALGHMGGTTAEAGVTVDNVVNGVWNAALIDYTGAGSAGLALSTASSGGVDPSILAAAVWAYATRSMTATERDAAAAAILAAAQATPIHSEIKKVAGESVTGSGTAGDPWGPA